MIEHTEVEITEPEEVPTPTAGPIHVHDHPSALDIIRASLATPLPCPVCGRTDSCRCIRPEGHSIVDQQAALIEQALIQYRHLPDPEDAGEFDPEEVAQWLAERSGFVRYTQVENGWKRLLEAEVDVELATLKALQRVPSSEVEMVKAAKAGLLAWHQSRTV